MTPRSIKALATAARWTLYALAVSWLLLALVWGGLHFLIVPRIGDFRPWLEQLATQRLKTPVSIGAIVARSNGLIPSVEVRDLRIFDATGHESLHLPRILAALSPRSLLGAGFEQLYLEQPALEVRRSADGRIWVAGLLLADNAPDSGAGMDWLFSQGELAVRHGSLRWVDELRGALPLDLADVDLVIRNRGRAHSLRVDADPPPEWGSRVTLMGNFLQPLFSTRKGDWKNWRGHAFAEAAQINLDALHAYVDAAAEVRQGAGALRLWVDLDQQRVTSASADLSMRDVMLKLSPQLDALGFERLGGRLEVQSLAHGYEFATDTLQFDLADGVHWPGGSVRLRLESQNAGKNGAQGFLEDGSGLLSADRLDLAMVATIAARLPLDDGLRAQLRNVAPVGQLEQLRYSWQGPLRQPKTFSASGRLSRLALTAQALTPAQLQAGELGVPGVQGASLEFDLTQSEGRANIAIEHGELVFPGVFEKPAVPMEQLAGDITWKVDGRHISAELNRLRFMNADAQGEMHVKWQTADLPHGAPASLRFPGLLDLQGSLSRAEVASVPRYIPLAVSRQVRDYLQQSLLGGTGNNVHFKVRGDLGHFSFTDPRHSDFRISADLQNATYAYAPAGVLPKDSAPWPALTQVSTEMLIDHDTLTLKSAHGQFAGSGGLFFSRTEGAINRLYTTPQLTVSAEARGPLAEALALVNNSPMGQWTGKALARAQGSGLADYKFKLAIPLDHMDKATVQGSVVLAGNDLQFSPDVPRVTRTRGSITFSESGFSVTGLQGRSLGGDVRFDGGLSVSGTGTSRNMPGNLHIQGTVTAEGLRQAAELGPVQGLARYLSGSTAFNAVLGIRAGFPELTVSSNLTGMAVALPAPLGKPAETALTLRYENSLVRTLQINAVRQQDLLRLDIGPIASVMLVRDITGAEPRVLRGTLSLGLTPEEALPLPASGVTASLHLDQLDLDAWSSVVGNAANASASPGAASAAPLSALQLAYLPNRLALRVGELTIKGRKIKNLVVGAGREDLLWRVNLDASEVNGYLEYRQPSGTTPGRLYARLAHLTIGQTEEQDMENLLDEQPASIPALDIVVNDLDLRGKKLGHVEIQAVNLGSGGPRDLSREWKLNRFNITTPEASLTASGNWANVAVAAGAPAGAIERSLRQRRRTNLNFKLEISDSGQLLTRMGMAGVLAKGKGTVEGKVGWLGSPVSPDYPSMTGGFNVDVENGQFLKADPGIAKLLGVLSLQSLPRRLVLDFRDVFSDGFAFDVVRGDVQIEQGIARTNNLQMKGVNAAVLMEGQADIDRETQMLKVVVIPEINAGSASLLASTINPLVGLTTFLAQVILRRPLIEANTQEFQIDGTWVDPHITRLERIK